jgi:hypothetical protein
MNRFAVLKCYIANHDVVYSEIIETILEVNKTSRKSFNKSNKAKLRKFLMTKKIIPSKYMDKIIE